MSKNKPYLDSIPAFYRRTTIDIMLFAHVQAVRHREPTMKLDVAILDFMQLYGIDSEDYSLECAKVNYNRTKVQFLWADMKNNIHKKNNLL